MPNRLRARHRGSVVLAALLLAATAFAAAPTITVEPTWQAVFDAVAAAYPGERPLPEAADADLELRSGDVDWRATDAVVVVPGAVLVRRTDDADAVAFQRFATSPDAQRALIAAGLLPATVTVRDQGGREVTVAQPVTRLASPYSLATYLAYGVGAGDRVVAAGFLGARDPDGIAAMTRIDPRFPDLVAFAGQETTNVEAIAALAPDVVFASARSEWIASVESIGVPVVVFDGESKEQLIDAMRLAGALFGPDAAARAEAWVAYFEDVSSRIARATGGLADPPRVLFTGTSRTRVASGEMYQSFLVETAGGVSVSAVLGGYWNDVNVEQVLLWDPAVVLVPPYGQASVAAVVEDPAWRLVRAVRGHDVHRVPKLVAPWDTPVPDSVLALVWLTEVLHPGLTDLSCEAESQFFYLRFYDYEMSSEEAADLCRR
jgi:iron complex transport system substrate-binding protein